MTENAPEKIVAESGVAFPDETDAEIFVEATFIESGTQLQQLFVGLEPVVIIQPEFDADENKVTFVVTAVDLNPQGMVDLFDVLLDSAKEMVSQQEQMRADAEEDAKA